MVLQMGSWMVVALEYWRECRLDSMMELVIESVFLLEQKTVPLLAWNSNWAGRRERSLVEYWDKMLLALRMVRQKGG